MTNRLETTFARLKAEGRAAFVAYVMAGDNDLATSEAILAGLPGAGADVIELGFPFSDPMAEGVPVQLAAQRSLAAGTTLTGVLEMVRRFRNGSPLPLDGGEAGSGGERTALDGERGVSESDNDRRASTPIPGPSPIEGEGRSTPIVLMGYTNPIFMRGYARFAREAAEAGIDGLIVVDCPPEEADDLADALDAQGVALIRLAAPTTDDARLQVVARRTSGFVYYVSVAGVTGTKEADEVAVAPAVTRIRDATGLPVAVGFGIRTPERAAAIARVADAAVVGSALVDEIGRAQAEGSDPVAAVLGKARALADAVHGARLAQALEEPA